ncbi:MAG: hypothetical protein RLZZ135_2639, partial [Cyanobacteriota bacterium]
LAVKFATLPASIDEQSSQLLDIGSKIDLTGMSWHSEQEEQLWSGIQTGIWGTSSIGCKLGVRSTAVVATISTLDDLTAHTARGVIHLSSGIGACSIDRATDISTLRTHCESAGGFMSVLQAPIEVKQEVDVWGYRGNGVALMHQLKHQFDPENILNPHRCFGVD